ncbi:site-specific DNA-methyltransferase [Aliarcobacter butzleri]|uniref:site-specific DNA-methyltransferase n=1 Tax=Aliarcobacter butzleri TaxID=28197 RepID=UPI00125F11F1|nr:site-specific DNA-methyltransferase [Aliarcobacter butzleri]
MPSLNWIGKKEIKNHHNNIEYRVLDCKESVGIDNSGNLIVKGDNLLALKALLPFYAGKVKMIYIDPPYNTGSTSWVYNDAVDSPTIKKWLKKTIDNNDLSRSDKWLCMIYPRLKLLHKFLKDDGVIFVSIDDAEVANLRSIMDNIFGKNNFITNFAWKKKSTSTNVEGVQVSSLFDNTLCYAKDSNYTPIKRRITFKDTRKYPFSDSVGNYRTSVIEKKNSGDYKRDTMVFEILGQKPREGKRWQIGLETAQQLEKTGRLFINENGIVTKKIYDFEDHDTESAQPNLLDNHGSTDSASKILKNIFGMDGVFPNPKPIELIEHFINITCNKNDLIMDSFAGSGTTGHAVLNYNNRNKTNHNFILIEMEDYAERITKERVKRVIEGYDFTGEYKNLLIEPIKLTAAKLLNEKFMGKLLSEVSEFIKQTEDKGLKVEKTLKDNTLTLESIQKIKSRVEGLGGGFQYCELSEPLLNDFGLLSEHVTFEMLAKHIFFTEFGVALEKQSMNKEDNYVGAANQTKLYIFMNKEFNIQEFQKIIKEEAEDYIVYVDTWSISADLLNKHNITIKRIPFEIKGA